MKPTRNGRSLGVTLIISIILAILLTPLGGFETRSILGVTTTGYTTLVIFFAGLILAAVSVILLFSKARIAATLAIVGSVLFFPVILADQARIFASLPPPTAITYLEVVTAIVLLVAIFFATRVIGESKAMRASDS